MQAAIKSGKLQLALGGKGGGKLFGGAGVPTKPMAQSPKGNPKLTMAGKPGAADARGKVSKEFSKYAAMGLKPSAHAPNTMVKGRPNANNTELVQQYKGDPENQRYRAGTPYYDVYTQQRRAAESPVNRENIPPAYRKQVKDYFESIKP